MLIYNSKTQKKEYFQPILEKNISLYVCGITPYDTTHLGHAFVYNFFDVLKRYLEYKKYKVIYTQNVTDIDDDTLKRAKRDKTDWKKLGEFWTKKFLKDLRSLNIRIPDNYVNATDYIDTMLDITKQLLKNGIAYEVNGTVYFKVEKFPQYGKLSKLNFEEMISISRERGGDPNDPQKQNPLDFILWQKQKDDEPFWISPWGKGRPGWHIECSAMIYDTLGEHIDIHGGGGDLIFPHHESEIAQSESFTKKSPFVNYWMHIGMLYYKGEKMSKSLGNLVLVENLLKTYSPNAIRWLLLSHHYRESWEYKEEYIKKAQEESDSFNQYLSKKNKGEIKIDILKQFENLMEDDSNTPDILKLLISLNEKVKNGDLSMIPTISKILTILGFY